MEQIKEELAIAEVPNTVLHEQPAIADTAPKPVAGAIKYEVSAYGYLRLNDSLTDEQQERIICFLYELLKGLFYKNYSRRDFDAIFFDENSQAITLDISKADTNRLDAQKLHWLLRSLRDTHKLLPVGWDVIRKKLIVYNRLGKIVGTVYQISEGKIPPPKKRNVEKLLQPLFDDLGKFHVKE